MSQAHTKSWERVLKWLSGVMGFAIYNQFGCSTCGYVSLLHTELQDGTSSWYRESSLTHSQDPQSIASGLHAEGSESEALPPGFDTAMGASEASPNAGTREFLHHEAPTDYATGQASSLSGQQASLPLVHVVPAPLSLLLVDLHSTGRLHTRWPSNSCSRPIHCSIELTGTAQ